MRERLESGYWFFAVDNEPANAELQRLWVAHREELLAEWILAQPGTRPWAWWRWDALSESRRRIGGTGTALLERPDGKHPVSFGTPNAYDDDYNVADPPKYESEREYLTRHGLLTKVER